MDILDDTFYEQLLRICGCGIVAYAAASPFCSDYSRLKLLPGGPKAIRTPDQLGGVSNLSESEQQRIHRSATMLERCVGCLKATVTAGGHGHLEQPANAMSWLEDVAKSWVQSHNCSLVLIAIRLHFFPFVPIGIALFA